MTDWAIRGELILNCNCTVFCPCVVSLGRHPPTEGHCQAWLGIRIDRGHFGPEPLDGLAVGMWLDIPGLMSRGDWKAAAFIDDRASPAAFDGLVAILSGRARGTPRHRPAASPGLVAILSGRARGTTGLFALLVSEFKGAERAPVTYQTEGKTRRLTVGRRIMGEVAPIPGPDPARDVVVSNTGYWMGPDITIATATKGRVRSHGRVWDFDGRSAEICRIDWHGPN